MNNVKYKDQSVLKSPKKILLKTVPCAPKDSCQLAKPFTKPPLIRRNRLTGRGNPTFESYAERNPL